MNNVVIDVDKVSKQYRLGVIGHGALYKDLQSWWANLVGKEDPNLQLRDTGIINRQGDLFWALQDVSFKVQEGEVVGVIGHNGAGKSTLLKILSRITAPSDGKINIKGRIASLLEVGTGFHPELTGRENVYLNGAILGMRKREIDQKIDEIIAFSEVDSFIDTPVKRYSSGMYVRLAFAVAAHLDPEILIVDEVLAVGDIAFQQKCLGKMGEVAAGGRTVLFVSHNMSAILSLCNRCILLSEGKLIAEGLSADIVAQYQAKLYSGLDAKTDLRHAKRFGNGKARFTSMTLNSSDENEGWDSTYRVGDNLSISLTIEAFEDVYNANVAIIIYDMSGVRIIDANTAIKNQFLSMSAGQTATIVFTLQKVLLKPARYIVGIWMGRTNIEDIDGVSYAKEFSIEIAPNKVESSQDFPGIYQCEYVHNICVCSEK